MDRTSRAQDRRGKLIAVAAHRIAYSPLPKAGCSSVKEALARIDPAVTLPSEQEIDRHTWHRIYPTARFRPHRWNLVRGYWRFCVVRDPVKRLLSVYTNRVREFGDLRNSIKLRTGRHGFGHLSREPDPDFFFQNLDAYRHASSSVKHHAMAAWLFLGPDLTRYDAIYRTEDMQGLAKDLSVRTGRPVTLRRRNRSAVRLRLDDLQDQTIDAIRPFLDREYAYFGPLFRNPLGPRFQKACAMPKRRVS
jgi:hypothetical protein